MVSGRFQSFFSKFLLVPFIPIGRKRLIVIAALCMVIEMLALLIAPMHGGSTVFLLFALNRIISGVAEAAVSGADEALAYDSLKEVGRERNGAQSSRKPNGSPRSPFSLL